MPPTVILTGASKGIGLATTRFLLDDGANVVTVQRSVTSGLEELAKKCPQSLRLVQGDFSEHETISRVVEESLQAFGSIDAVVFNAAMSSAIAPITAASLEGWRQTFEINVFGVVRFLKAVLPSIKDGGRIISVSSEAAELAFATTGAYSASKAALNSLNRTLAAENPTKICVAVHPGTTNTEMLQEFINISKASNSLPESVQNTLAQIMIEPEVPGRVIANLALRAPADLSGRFIHYNAKEILDI